MDSDGSTPFGVLRNSPVMFGTEQYQPTRKKVKPMIGVAPVSTPQTSNEQTSIASRCFGAWDLPQVKHGKTVADLESVCGAIPDGGPS
jgi:hypothetical protein